MEDTNHQELIEEEVTEDFLPGVLERVKAAMVDVVVLTLCMFGFSYLFGMFEHVPDFVRISAFVFVFALYDPILTSFSGGTVGHKVMKLEVKKQSNHSKNIIFPLAVLRYAVKAFLGWLSLLTVGFNDEKLAIHDLAGGSIVKYRENQLNK